MSVLVLELLTEGMSYVPPHAKICMGNPDGPYDFQASFRFIFSLCTSGILEPVQPFLVIMVPYIGFGSLLDLNTV